jgi:alpha-glucoside transport system permease protein
MLSFKDSISKEFVGLDNYKFVFTDDTMLTALRNTAGWLILVPVVAVSIGLAFATLADRLRRGEAVAKSMIFLPMAISLAGASITWQLIYSYRPKGFGSNIGLLNGVMLGLGHDPVQWLYLRPWNNLFLMVIMVWMQTGFAMVVLSAAIKAIPDEIIEAARIDGASEMQVFRKIIVPSIVPTIVVVTTYMVINAMKVFDIVFVQRANADANGTVVVAERMIRWFFLLNNNGRGAAIAVVLFVAVIPVMVWNVRRFREQEAIR